MFYRDEYGYGKCVHCKNQMHDMDEYEPAWQVCLDCFFVCIPSHFISNESEAHESWHYIFPTFENNIIIKSITVYKYYDWYYIENKVIKYTCTCGNNSCCNNVLPIPNKFPFEIQIFSKN
jgi:hypothetical protein